MNVGSGERNRKYEIKISGKRITQNQIINRPFLAHEHLKMADSLKSLTFASMFTPKVSKLSKFVSSSLSI